MNSQLHYRKNDTVEILSVSSQPAFSLTGELPHDGHHMMTVGGGKGKIDWSNRGGLSGHASKRARKDDSEFANSWRRLSVRLVSDEINEILKYLSQRDKLEAKVCDNLWW